jgi:hypothetical protein
LLSSCPQWQPLPQSGGVGALGTTFAQIYGNKYVGYRDQGIDPEAANMGSLVSAALSAPIEYAGNIFQLGLIGRAAGKLGLNKVASGKVAKFLSKNGKTVKGIIAKSAGRLGLGMAGEGSEEVGQPMPKLLVMSLLSCRTIRICGLMLGRR